jgi:hypothetical protein
LRREGETMLENKLVRKGAIKLLKKHKMDFLQNFVKYFEVVLWMTLSSNSVSLMKNFPKKFIHPSFPLTLGHDVIWEKLYDRKTMMGNRSLKSFQTLIMI